MKLNVGCGKTYLKGFENIDAYDDTVADRLMQAFSLEYADECIEEIRCIQVLEHLGAAKSIYALAEFYRVLEPGGILRLETPAVEESFESFLGGKREERKLAMNWIYGLDCPGMGHKYGFPVELMKEMLENCGFIITLKKITEKNTLQPSLVIETKKPEQGLIHSLTAQVRKKLVQKKFVNLDDQIDTLDKEEIIDYAKQSMPSIMNDPAPSRFYEVIRQSALKSPLLTKVVLSVFSEHLDLPSEHLDTAHRLLDELIHIKFPSILANMFQNLSIRRFRQNEAFNQVKQLGIASITKLLREQVSNSDLSELKKASGSIRDFKELEIFSKQKMESIAAEQFALGLRAFSQEKFQPAHNHFQAAAKLDRDNIAALWNLGRLSGILNLNEKRAHYYELAISLANQIRAPFRERIQRTMNEERRAEGENMQRLTIPVSSLQQLKREIRLGW